MLPYASLNTQRFAAKKGPNVKLRSLKRRVPIPPETFHSLYGCDKTNNTETRPVTNNVTGRNLLKERFGYNNKVDQDSKSMTSLKRLCNMVAPFSHKNKLLICNMNSFSTITNYNNVFWKSSNCLKGNIMLN